MFYVNNGQLEFDWIARPDADTGDLSVPVFGSDRIEPLADGSIRICSGQVCLLKKKPVAWQSSFMGKQFVDVSYSIEGNRVRLNIGKYDRGRALVVDPVLTWLSLLGGSGDETPGKIKAAPDGGAYIFFSSSSPSLNFPATATAVTPALKSGNRYAVLAKISPDGSTIEKIAYFGGSGTTTAAALALDTSGNSYLGGTTNAADFPLKNAFRSRPQGYEGFAVKLTPDFEVIYSTFVGGSQSESVYGIAADAQGRMYLTGWTGSSDFVTVRAAVPTIQASSAGFIMRLGTSGVPEYSTFCGRLLQGTAITVDDTGAAYVAFVDGTPGIILGSDSSRIVKVSSDGSQFVFTKDLANFDIDVNAMLVDAGHTVHFAGWRLSLGLTSTPSNGYYATLSPDGATLTYKLSTPAQSSSAGSYMGLGMDSAGNIYLCAVNSQQWPTTGGFQPYPFVRSDVGDAYVAKYSAAGAMIWGSYLKGSDYDYAWALDVTPNGVLYLSGLTRSSDFPVIDTAPQTEIAGGAELWFAKIEETSAGCSYGVKSDRVSVSANGGDGSFVWYRTGPNAPGMRLRIRAGFEPWQTPWAAASQP